jgi:hypothetical protein
MSEELPFKEDWIEFYPEKHDEETDPYHVEFTYGRDWALFKANPVHDKLEWERLLKEANLRPASMFFTSRFGHPWHLGGGELDKDGCVGMTKEFIKYMVDALNEKYRRELC